ncbi:10240_t:CDS:2, partial [Acaulospora colombiana]
SGKASPDASLGFDNEQSLMDVIKQRTVALRKLSTVNNVLGSRSRVGRTMAVNLKGADQPLGHAVGRDRILWTLLNMHIVINDLSSGGGFRDANTVKSANRWPESKSKMARENCAIAGDIYTRDARQIGGRWTPKLREIMAQDNNVGEGKPRRASRIDPTTGDGEEK